MPSNSNIDLARSARALPLTRSMVELLGRMMTAIDRRVHMLMDAEEDDFEPDTCAACAGTGFILVPIEDFVIRVPDDETESTAHAPTRAYAMVATPAVVSANAEVDPTAVSPITFDSVPAPVASAPVPAIPAPAPVVTAPASVIPATAVLVPAPVSTVPAPASTVPAPASTIIAPATTITAPVSTIPALAPAIPALAPAIPALAPTAPAPILPVPAPANLAPAIFVPAQSQTVPGFHSLGPNYPIPAPTSAVFTDDTADRFYTVTKGIRVGVFGGWQNTSPYVQGVPGASFSRHSTISAAYTAYTQAHLRGFVTYV